MGGAIGTPTEYGEISDPYAADRVQTQRLQPQNRGLAGQQILTRDYETWYRDNGVVKRDQEPVSFDRWLRGIVTGNWDGAEHERALSVGTPTAGGHMVPMTSTTMKVARLGEGAPAWRNENAPVTAGDLTFDVVTFTAKSLDRLVIMSRELFEDSDLSASDVIARPFAQQLT